MRRAATMALALGMAGLTAFPASAAKKDAELAAKLGLDGTFRLELDGSGKCMSNGSGDKLGMQINAWKCHPTTSSQKFQIKWADGPWFTLRTARGGLCIEVSGSARDDGKPVVQWSCTGQANQLWKVVNVSGGCCWLQAQHAGKCLTLDGPDERVSRFTQRACGSKEGVQRTSAAN